MPTDAQGYSAAEIIALLKLYTGNKSNDFQNYISYELSLAEFRYCKRHDWSFLYQEDLALSITSGTAKYSLSPATIGFYMSASDVITIRDESMNRILRKTTIDDIRRMDPNDDDGQGANDGPIYWAPAGDNKIILYPRIFSTTTLKIDGKVTPSVAPTATIQGIAYSATAPKYDITIAHVVAGNSIPLSVSVVNDAIIVNLATDSGGVATSTAAQVVAAIASSTAASALVTATGTGVVALVAQAATLLSKYFVIPYRYQNSFIEWLKGIALDRENDGRAPSQIAKADSLVDQDVEDDLANLGDTILPRIKATWEQYLDGATNNADQAYLMWMFYGCD